MVTPGGETAFISRLIRESVQLGERVKWYSTMVGKYSSITPIIEELKTSGVTNWAVMEFINGNRTRRWGIAWSFGYWRPSVSSARGIGSLPKHLLPFPAEFDFAIANPSTSPISSVLRDLEVRLCKEMENLDLQWRYRTAQRVGIGFAGRNVWSRAARRKIVKSDGKEEEDGEDEDEMAFGFKISFVPGHEGKGVDFKIRWLKGEDPVLFESFCGMVRRKLGG
jgi:23S rRNA (adenine1618-N6)-methyltransferase